MIGSLAFDDHNCRDRAACGRQQFRSLWRRVAGINQQSGILLAQMGYVLPFGIPLDFGE